MYKTVEEVILVQVHGLHLIELPVTPLHCGAACLSLDPMMSSLMWLSSLPCKVRGGGFRWSRNSGIQSNYCEIQ